MIPSPVKIRVSAVCVRAVRWAGVLLHSPIVAARALAVALMGAGITMELLTIGSRNLLSQQPEVMPEFTQFSLLSGGLIFIGTNTGHIGFRMVANWITVRFPSYERLRLIAIAGAMGLLALLGVQAVQAVSIFGGDYGRGLSIPLTIAESPLALAGVVGIAAYVRASVTHTPQDPSQLPVTDPVSEQIATVPKEQQDKNQDW